jgi:hypothetical protein
MAVSTLLCWRLCGDLLTHSNAPLFRVRVPQLRIRCSDSGPRDGNLAYLHVQISLNAMGCLSRKKNEDSKRSFLFGGRKKNKDSSDEATPAARIPNELYSQRCGGHSAQGESHSAQSDHGNDRCGGMSTPAQRVGGYGDFGRTTSQETGTVNADCDELFGNAAQRQQVLEPQHSDVYGQSSPYGHDSENGGDRQAFDVYELEHDVARTKDEIRHITRKDNKTLDNATMHGFNAILAGSNTLANLHQQGNHLRGYVIPNRVVNFGYVADIGTVLKDT